MLVQPYQLAARGESRQVRMPLVECARLAALAAPEDAAAVVTVDLAFERDDQGDCHVTGSAAVALSLRCGNCGQRRPFALDVRIDYRLFRDEARASERGRSIDVMICATEEIELAALVEDDLLLAVPDVPCGLDAACPHREPAMREAAPDAAVGASPFEVLRALKRGREH